MRRFFTYLMFWSMLVSMVSFARSVVAAPVAACFCYTEVQEARADATCVPLEPAQAGDCARMQKDGDAPIDGGRYMSCQWLETADSCTARKTEWNNERAAYLKSTADGQSGGSGSGSVSSLSEAISKCGSQERPSGECADVSIFVVLLIEIARYGFSIIGAVALLFFIYGGVLMIISAGNAEKVEQGTGAIMAALLGLVIAFGGYLLVQALGDLVGLKDTFRLK